TRVILEAFAAGVPVIAFRSGGITEVIDNGVNGLLACDAADMAELAILLLTGDPRRLISISRCARESWERRFHIERRHQDVLRVISSAAGVGGAVGFGMLGRPPSVHTAGVARLGVRQEGATTPGVWCGGGRG